MSKLVTFGETSIQLSPPGKERLETARDMRIYADGIESNAAVAASQVGTPSTWISKLVSNALSRRVVGELERYGIETSITWASDPEARQGLVFREAGHPPRESQRYHDRGRTAVSMAEPSDVPMETVQKADVVFAGLSTSALSKDAESTVTAMLRAAYGSGPMTALAVDYHRGFRPPADLRDSLESLLGHVNIFIGQEDDVRTILDRTGEPRELANAIATDYGVETAVISGSSPSAVALQNTPGTKVMYEREATDQGAIDDAGQDGAFAGAFLARLSDGADLSEALDYGVAAAALARTVPGPFLTASRPEIESVVSDVVSSTR